MTEFIPSIRTLFEKGGYAKISNNRESGGTFLVGLNARLFAIHADFQVNSSKEGIMACGCVERTTHWVRYTVHARQKTQRNDC